MFQMIFQLIFQILGLHEQCWIPISKCGDLF